MGKLLDVVATRDFLIEFVKQNDASLAFLSTMDGGIICSNDFKARMVVESLSTFWQALLPPHWKRIGFEWETSYIILVNCGGWIFGLQQNDPNPLTLGLLRLKATKCAEFIKSKLEEN